jgi:hypothetical protein
MHLCIHNPVISAPSHLPQHLPHPVGVEEHNVVDIGVMRDERRGRAADHEIDPSVGKRAPQVGGEWSADDHIAKAAQLDQEYAAGRLYHGRP